MSFLAQFLYLLGLVVWIGGIVFFSFVATPTIFADAPSKEVAGQLITALFPKYYSLGYVAGGAMLLATLVESTLVRQLPLIRLLVLAVMLGASVYAGMVVRPQVHDLKVQMRSVEADSDIGKSLKVRFDGLHRLSVMLNMVVLGSGLFLVGILALRLRL